MEQKGIQEGKQNWKEGRGMGVELGKNMEKEVSVTELEEKEAPVHLL